MTSEEIKQLAIPAAADKEHVRNLWLREIALQLALQNEREERGDRESVNRMLRKVGLEGMEIGPGHPVSVDTEVVAIEGAFPFVSRDGVRGGREWWGVWYGPGPAARSFPTREAAEKHLAENPPLRLMPPAAKLPPPIAPSMDGAHLQAKAKAPQKRVRSEKAKERRSGFRY